MHDDHTHGHTHVHTHEHAHDHTHSHDHAPEQNHSHPQAHDHDHPHEHDHGHDHDHGHGHGHSHGNVRSLDQNAVPGASAKDLALLKYMLDHNKQHARELSETGDRLAEAGFAHAAEMISDAVHYFDHANDSLEIAVGLINA